MSRFGLVYNNEVVVGPREYRYSAFNDFLINKGIDFELPKIYEDTVMLGGVDFKILPVTDIITPNVGKYEQLSGPTIQIFDTYITETYGTEFKSIDAVKNEMKTEISANRYIKETADIKLTIQGIEVIVEADRTNKMMIIQITGLMSDTDINIFKFPKSNNWLAMTKADMNIIVMAFITQTQTAFNWEQITIEQINAATTFAELDLIDLGDVVVTGV